MRGRLWGLGSCGFAADWLRVLGLTKQQHNCAGAAHAQLTGHKARRRLRRGQTNENENENEKRLAILKHANFSSVRNLISKCRFNERKLLSLPRKWSKPRFCFPVLFSLYIYRILYVFIALPAAVLAFVSLSLLRYFCFCFCC